MAGWARWLLAPLHALALASRAKSFEANPLLGSPALNRRGLHLTRRCLAQRLGTRRRAALAGELGAEERATFDRDGFLVIPDFLPAADFAALRAEILGKRAAARESTDGSTVTRLIPLDAAALRDLPATRTTVLGPRYRGCTPMSAASARRRMSSSKASSAACGTPRPTCRATGTATPSFPP
ncbi:hypothetical protein [Dankookia sp. P2]|uniref:hypothetical protein n=1 Tax=Dankookia sp. P2 TaxID=3423955 RepID=UPI003D66C735